MKRGIKIGVLNIPDGDHLYNFQLSISNGLNFSTIEIWGYEDLFKKFGFQLLDFPKKIDDKATFTLGEETIGEIEWAYLIKIEVSLNSNSQTVMFVHFKNQSNYETEKFDCKFYFLVEPYNLNELGKMLVNWKPKMSDPLLWEVRESEN